MKQVLRETQTLRTGCSKVDPKFFAPPQTPFSGTQDPDPVWCRWMHAIWSYRGDTPTSKQTNKHKQTGNYNTLRHSLACSVMIPSMVHTSPFNRILWEFV